MLVVAVAALLLGHASARAEWVLTPLHNFSTATPAKGIGPYGALAMDSSGALYGTTRNGGNGSGFGTIFKLTKRPNGTWKHEVLYAFPADGNAAPKGAWPESGVVLKGGALYGTTTLGGKNGGGTVYRLAKGSNGWRLEVLHHIDLLGGEGKGNRGQLAFDKQGNFYGTTWNTDGNFPGDGIVYELEKQPGGKWKFKILHAFTGGNGGQDPSAGVLIGKNGELYGLTNGTFTAPTGTLYKLTPNAGRTKWKHQVLYRLGDVSEGRYPTGTLARDSDGVFYGSTYSGGYDPPSTVDGYGGVVFSFDPSTSTFKVLHRFQTVPDDGFSPLVSPILRGDTLYGVTTRGGTGGDGLIYKLSPRAGLWKETQLHPFIGGTEGSAPSGSLLLKSGVYYGTAKSEGALGGGSVFQFANVQ